MVDSQQENLLAPFVFLVMFLVGFMIFMICVAIPVFVIFFLIDSLVFYARGKGLFPPKEDEEQQFRAMIRDWNPVALLRCGIRKLIPHSA